VDEKNGVKEAMPVSQPAEPNTLSVNVFTAPGKAMVGERPKPFGEALGFDPITSTLIFGEYDAVLVDAPCSNIGIAGRHPELRWRKQIEDGQRLAPAQLSILERAAERSAAAGTILYVTCSTDPREDEDVVRAFLTRSEGWRSAPLQVPANSAAMIAIGDFLLTLPGVDGADGFFFARLERRAAC